MSFHSLYVRLFSGFDPRPPDLPTPLMMCLFIGWPNNSVFQDIAAVFLVIKLAKLAVIPWHIVDDTVIRLSHSSFDFSTETIHILSLTAVSVLHLDPFHSEPRTTDIEISSYLVTSTGAKCVVGQRLVYSLTPWEVAQSKSQILLNENCLPVGARLQSWRYLLSGGIGVCLPYNVYVWVRISVTYSQGLWDHTLPTNLALKYGITWGSRQLLLNVLQYS